MSYPSKVKQSVDKLIQSIHEISFCRGTGNAAFGVGIPELSLVLLCGIGPTINFAVVHFLHLWKNNTGIYFLKLLGSFSENPSKLT